MATRTSIATDDFNRASLGANWTNLNTDWSSVRISSSTFIDCSGAGAISSQGAAAVWAGSGTFTNDHYSSIVVNGLSFLSSDYRIGVIVRASTDTNGARDFYGFEVAADSGGPTYTATLYKIVNGTYTALNSAAITIANGDRLELEAEGTTLRGCKNGTPLGGSWTQTDSSLSTGKPGVAGSGTSINGDNWDGGSLTASSSSAPRSHYYRMMRTA